MAAHERLAAGHIRGIVETAARLDTPIALTCRLEKTWLSYRSRLIGLGDDGVWIECPVAPSGEKPAEFAVDQKISVAFKQRHYKYVFSTNITATGDFQTDQGESIRGLYLSWPAVLHQLQRRMYNRVIVPVSCRVFVNFWETGLAREPQEHLSKKLIYCGQIVDLSAGGFSIRLLTGDDPGFRFNGAIGAELNTEWQMGTIKVDARFRHVAIDEFGVLLGMQMMGLVETAAGQEALRKINQLLDRLQRPEHARTRLLAAG